MTLHDPSIGMSYGRDWHTRWYRGGRNRPGPAGPGSRVRARYRRKLAAIERALVADTPALSSKFALFNNLTRGERPVGVEQVPGPALPRVRRAHVAVLLALAAVVTMCIALSARAHVPVRPCAASVAASLPVRGLSCAAYAGTKQ